MAMAASGSVGETMAPKANAAGQPSSGMTACSTTATATMVSSTSPKALSEMARACVRISCSEAK